nr:hypothetical protein CFP56_57100 [Quercus suber]
MDIDLLQNFLCYPKLNHHLQPGDSFCIHLQHSNSTQGFIPNKVATRMSQIDNIKFLRMKSLAVRIPNQTSSKMHQEQDYMHTIIIFLAFP